ncbi:MAG: divergent polysaccharide deacetylase family protein [Acidobacteria bacterium]|nr:divergent polysaccharide deacetylase family protein [Acidobacteriota bacterium]
MAKRRRKKPAQKPWLRTAAALGLVVVLAGIIVIVLRGRGTSAGRGHATETDFGDRIRALAERRGAHPSGIDADDPIRKVNGVFVRHWAVSLPAGSVRGLTADLEAEAASWQGRFERRPVRHGDAAHLRISFGTEAFDIRLVAVPRRRPRRKSAATPLPTPPLPRPTPTLSPARRGKLAILLDDAGQSMELVPAAAALPEAVAVAVLPFLPHSVDTAAELHRTGHEIWLHLPMEPNGYPSRNPGPGAVLTSMSEEDVRRTVRSALNNVPFIVGVNNHMGSKATANLRVMTWVMQEISARGLAFLDSRTTAATVAEEAARAQGIHTGRRKVFLDNSSAEAAIERQLSEAIYRARREGSLIAIGHLHGPTLRVLERELPGISSRGIDLVPPSELVR